MKKKRILVCPLDWGIGHASRDIIIIKKLLEKDNEVILGGDGPSLKFLISEFPYLESVKIPTHKFYYSTKLPAWFMIVLQIPAFLNGIRIEHLYLKKIIKFHRIDLVISDSRYGLWNIQIPSVIITHQVKIRMPVLFKPFEPLVNYLNRLALKKFNYHWIPDLPDEQNLSGLLSHHTKKTFVSKYIGCISRFMDTAYPVTAAEHFEILVLLSGPEPQRSVFEKIVTAQLLNQHRGSLIIGGQLENIRAGKQSVSILHKKIPFLSGNELFSLLISAKYIICRAGYSTIMDLAAIRRTAFLVPTPGQTEQEYLAVWLRQKGLFRSSDQKDFNLADALKMLDETGSPDFSFVKNNLLDNALDEFLTGTRSN